MQGEAGSIVLAPFWASDNLVYQAKLFSLFGEHLSLFTAGRAYVEHRASRRRTENLVDSLKILLLIGQSFGHPAL